MLSKWEMDKVSYYMRLFCGCSPDETFWQKATQYDIREVVWAIRKAAQEQNCSLQHITAIVGQVTKEGNSYVYKHGTERPAAHETLSF